MKRQKRATRGYGLLENFLAKKRADKADLLIPEDLRSGRILDIGCGSYPYFLLNTKFNKKFGIDPSIHNLSVQNGVNLKRAKAEKKLQFGNDFFDVVTMLAVFEHIDSKKINYLLNEVKRVLKKDGLFIITTPSPWADYLLHAMGKVGLISSQEINEHKHNHKRKKIESMIEEAGFDRKKIKSGFFEFYANMWFVVSK